MMQSFFLATIVDVKYLDNLIFRFRNFRRTATYDHHILIDGFHNVPFPTNRSS